jgi:hypothetical protein
MNRIDAIVRVSGLVRNAGILITLWLYVTGQGKNLRKRFGFHTLVSKMKCSKGRGHEDRSELFCMGQPGIA